jgi:hypothetical protein
MKIDDALHLVLPLGDGLHAYHTPISRAVYEGNYSTINATKAALAKRGVHYQMGSGPRVATLTLKDEGVKDAADRDNLDADGKPVDDRTPALLAEIKRLTTVLCPGPGGWDLLPIDAAISQEKVDREDWEEVESSIVFFTAHYQTCRRATRAGVAKATASVLNGSITSSPPMEFIASLPTSTKNEATQANPSSLPL